ncbi:MAG: hypothetical protein IT349_09120 [Candidatus Eisenbacteria bacterium]|nr:hypothetical protein [Candidatus Eisenbacteria bacterium]
MRSLVAVAGAAILLAPVRQACGAVVAGPCVNAANGHAYYLLAPASWTESEAEAIALGGHLVAINDEPENEWVWQTFHPLGAGQGDQGNLWIGYSDAASEGEWEWGNGEPVTWQHWAPFEPNNVNGENYAHMVGSGFQGHEPGYWNDILDSGAGGGGGVTTPRGVVELIPNPAGVEMPETQLSRAESWGRIKARFVDTASP